MKKKLLKQKLQMLYKVNDDLRKSQAIKVLELSISFVEKAIELKKIQIPEYKKKVIIHNGKIHGMIPDDYQVGFVSNGKDTPLGEYIDPKFFDKFTPTIDDVSEVIKKELDEQYSGTIINDETRALMCFEGLISKIPKGWSVFHFKKAETIINEDEKCNCGTLKKHTKPEKEDVIFPDIKLRIKFVDYYKCIECNEEYNFKR